MKRDVIARSRRFAALSTAGSASLALATWACFWLGLNSAITAFVYLGIVVVLSLFDSFILSVAFSVIAVGCLDFFFIEPLFSFNVADPQDAITLVAFLITSLAVTGLARRVRHLREVEKQQTKLLDLADGPIVVRDVNDAITYWNRGAEELYGWKKEEAIGKVSHELLRTVFSTPLELLTETLRSTGRWEGELLHTKRDDTPVSVTSRWTLLRDDGRQPAGILETNSDITGRQEAYLAGIAQKDITARKQAEEALGESEQRFRHLFDHMPIALLQLDAGDAPEMLGRLRAEGVKDLSAYFVQNPELLVRIVDAFRIEDVNEQAIKIFGAQNREQMLAPLSQVLRIKYDTYRRNIDSRFRGIPMYQEETKLLTLDGREIDILFTAARLGSANAPRMGLVAIIDTTEQVRAQERLEQVRAEFAHAARISVLGELTASIAHEINQPLAAIRTNSETALRRLDDTAPNAAKVRELLQRVVDDAGRAADIIARVRTMAAGRPQQPTMLSLHTIIEESIGFLHHELQSKGISITYNFAAALPQIVGDRIQLQQVVVNLIINAIQAMASSESGGRVLLIQTQLSDGETVRCAFEDGGPGIDPRQLGRLFDSFFTTKDSGMGLGLAVSRSIIEAHGGKMQADNNSTLGGARVSFVLPINATSAR